MGRVTHLKCASTARRGNAEPRSLELHACAIVGAEVTGTLETACLPRADGRHTATDLSLPKSPVFLRAQVDPSSTVSSRRRSTAGVPSARWIGARDSAYPHAHGSRGLPELRLAVPQRTDGRLLVAHRLSASQTQDQDLDCTEATAYLERIRAVVSSGIIVRASGFAPVASSIKLKTHLGSTTSSRRTRRRLSVAARS